MRDALLAQPPRTAWLVATGALTNVALVLGAFPELASHVRGLSVMGGAVGGGFTGATMARDGRVGNVTRWAEFNIYVRYARLRFFRAWAAILWAERRVRPDVTDTHTHVGGSSATRKPRRRFSRTMSWPKKRRSSRSI